MIERIRAESPHPHARLTGIVYLLYFLTAVLAAILAGHKLVAYGIATNLIATSCYLVLTLLFYGLFKPVSRLFSLIGALFGLTGCIVMTLGFFPRVSLPISPFLFFGPYCGCSESHDDPCADAKVVLVVIAAVVDGGEQIVGFNEADGKMAIGFHIESSADV